MNPPQPLILTPPPLGSRRSAAPSLCSLGSRHMRRKMVHNPYKLTGVRCGASCAPSTLCQHAHSGPFKPPPGSRITAEERGAAKTETKTPAQSCAVRRKLHTMAHLAQAGDARGEHTAEVAGTRRAQQKTIISEKQNTTESGSCCALNGTPSSITAPQQTTACFSCRL